MKATTARKLVAKTLPKHRVREEKLAADSSRLRPAVEVISPSLRALKKRYFSDNAAEAPPLQADAEDSGLVQVERETTGGKSTPTQTILFSKGRKIASTG